jgi:hypothetical protein
MKLMWKLNALVLLLCLISLFCSEAEVESQVERKKHLNMYEANDKLLNEVESQKSVSKEAELSHHTFLENKAKKMATGLVIIHGENEKLNISSELQTSQKCEYKNGFLEIIDKESPRKVQTKKVRVNLTKESLKMYTTMDDNSLFATIQLDNILKISQDKRFFQTNCFDLVTNLADSQEKVLHMSRLTLCTEKTYEMSDWMHFILELKECKVNQKNKDSKVILDFNEINKIKNRQNKSINGNEENLGLWYDNTGRSSTNNALNVKDRIIHQTVKSLINNMQTHQIEENKIKRTLNDQLKEARHFTQEIEKKNEIVKDIINKKIEKQIDINLKNVNIKAADKEVELIKAMAEKIKDMKVIFINFRKINLNKKKK